MKYIITIICSLCFLYSCSSRTLSKNEFIIVEKLEYQKNTCRYKTTSKLYHQVFATISTLIIYDI